MNETWGCSTTPHPAAASKKAFWNLGNWLFEIQPGAINIKKLSMKRERFQIENISELHIQVNCVST